MFEVRKIETLVFRLQRHLVRCRKAYTGNDIDICRFNVGHHVAKAEMEDHEKTCRDRVVVEKIMLESAKRSHDTVETQDKTRSLPATSDVDDWDQVTSSL